MITETQLYIDDGLEISTLPDVHLVVVAATSSRRDEVGVVLEQSRGVEGAIPGPGRQAFPVRQVREACVGGGTSFLRYYCTCTTATYSRRTFFSGWYATFVIFI